MVVNAPITAHTEIFNTYGETLSNAQLLTQYGFVIEGNDNDRVTFGKEVTEIIDVVVESRIETGWLDLYKGGPETAWPEKDAHQMIDGLISEATTPVGFWVDSDGKISKALSSLVLERIRQQVGDGEMSALALVLLIGLCTVELCNQRLRSFTLPGDSEDIGEIFDVCYHLF